VDEVGGGEALAEQGRRRDHQQDRLQAAQQQVASSPKRPNNSLLARTNRMNAVPYAVRTHLDTRPAITACRTTLTDAVRLPNTG
jgi:hypothetical protein